MPSELQNFLLLIPLVLATAIGWWLGRRERVRPEIRPATNLSQEYFAGLDYLLNEKMDEAIESFIRALEINSDTIPAHLALAKLFRRKGDVDRAIRLHQNLLARPDLSRDDFLRIQMALARDYYAVGLLDRAENLLEEIIRQSPPAKTRFNALSLLVKLYEKEGEWAQALSTAEKMEPDQQRELGADLAHYCCELAQASIDNGEMEQASRQLKVAARYDDRQVRIFLLDAELEFQQGHWRQAIKSFKKAHSRDPLFIPETISRLQTCYQELGQVGECAKYLKRCMAEYPSTSLMLALAEQVHEKRGVYAAGSYITEELKKRPSVRGFNRLIDFHMHQGEGEGSDTQDQLRVLRGLTGQLELSKPVYRCNSCGFSGRSLLWHCPSCQKWGSTKPIQGLEGE